MSRRSLWSIVLATSFACLVVVSSGNIPQAHAQPKAPVVPPAPQEPTLNTLATLGGRVGESFELTLTGTRLNDPIAVVLSAPGKVTIPKDNKNGTDPTKLQIKVELAKNCPIGLHTIRIATRQGVSNFRPFVVDDLPLVNSSGTNRSLEKATSVELPVVVAGRCDAETSEFYRVKVAAGQTLTCEVLARRLGSPLDPVLLLHDVKKQRAMLELYIDDTPGLQSDCRLTHTFKEAGEYIVEVRDSTYRGGPLFCYRLRMGEFPGATTAYPLAVQRGQSGKIGFAGPNCGDIPPVNISAPMDPAIAVGYVAPKRAGGVSGWPLPVFFSDWPEVTEEEPNDEPGKATKLPVPGGVSAKFDKIHDLDHFAIEGKKGQKLVVVAQTYEINAPTEVLIRVLDSKGAEIARSNPAQPTAKVEFTPAADGRYILACEHLNYLFGPNEIYHLSVRPVLPDIEVFLALDRGEAVAGDGTAVLATVNRLNGYTGPVELTIRGDSAVSGAMVLPAGQTFTFLPLTIKSGTTAGPYRYRVEGKIKTAGQDVVRLGTLIDLVRANLDGMPNPPRDLLFDCFVDVVEKPAFSVNLKPEPPQVEKGKTGKVIVQAKREEGFSGDITIAPLLTPPNITAAPTKPIPKDKTDGEVALTVAPAAAVGPAELVFRVTGKVGGQDFALLPPPLAIEVIEPKKTETKKEEPKKEEPKKKP